MLLAAECSAQARLISRIARSAATPLTTAAPYSSGQAKIAGCTITGNGSGAYGGGIYNYNANMMILQCTIGGNATGTDYYGGGLYNLDGTVIVAYSTFTDNLSGEYGGGIYNDGNAFLFNSTLDHNNADEHGGGLYNDSTAAVVNCTFAYNTAKNGYYGGGLYNDGTATLRALDLQPQHRGLRRWRLQFPFRHDKSRQYNRCRKHRVGRRSRRLRRCGFEGNNLIGNTSDSKGWGNSDVLNQNPLLLSLGNYGGPTPDHGDSREQPCQARRQPRLLSHFE